MLEDEAMEEGDSSWAHDPAVNLDLILFSNRLIEFFGARSSLLLLNSIKVDY